MKRILAVSLVLIIAATLVQAIAPGQKMVTKTRTCAVEFEPAIGPPPPGYHWAGEIRTVTRRQRVNWVQDWSYSNQGRTGR